MKRITTFLFLLALLIGACAPAATEMPGEPTSIPTPMNTSEVLLQIILADGSTYDVTLDAAKSLPLARITVEGKTEEGPKLLDILLLAGVSEFNEVLIEGSSSPCSLSSDQVDDNTILDFTNRGTLKLATTYVSKADWTKDVSKITVK
jgi:hypothetical protein